MTPYQIHYGNCLDVIKEIPDNSIDAIITDPPYVVSIMGRKWDMCDTVFQENTWRELSRILKPSGIVMAFGATKKFYHLVAALKHSDFHLQGTIAWTYGSGMPKSHNISKFMDKALGATREKVKATGGLHKNRNMNDDGWCKIGMDEPTQDSDIPVTAAAAIWNGYGSAIKPSWEAIVVASRSNIDISMPQFIYSPKACPRERHEGCEHLLWKTDKKTYTLIDEETYNTLPTSERANGNIHVTVKPLKLMNALCNVIPNGTILDPFMGSGSTGVAAVSQDKYFIGIDSDISACTIAEARIRAAHERN